MQPGAGLASGWLTPGVMRTFGGLAHLVLSLSFLTVTPAQAADKAHTRPSPAPTHDPPLPPGEAPRPMPDYAGRPKESSTSEALLWIPRISLFPAYWISEAVKQPLGAVLTVAERDHWRERWYEFFTFGPQRQIGLFPTGRVDLGLRPSAGVYFFWHDVVGASDFKLHATTGGLDSWQVRSLWRAPLTYGSQLELTLNYNRQPDRAFHGFGPSSPDQPLSYTEGRLDARTTLLHAATEHVTFSWHGGLRHVAFDAQASNESLAQAIAAGTLPAPPGLEGFSTLYDGLGVRLDTRSPRLTPAPETLTDLERGGVGGVSVALRAEHEVGVRSTRSSPAAPPRLPHWLRYGASFAGAVDLTETRRTLELATRFEFVQPLPADNPIPFTEQVSLGGQQPLRAFRARRLTDRSAVVTSLTYRWPIWVYLDGNLHYEVGNVFGANLDGFEVGLLRSSFGIGFDSVESADHPFELLVAFGTKPWSMGGAVESVRFVLGTRAGF